MIIKYFAINALAYMPIHHCLNQLRAARKLVVLNLATIYDSRKLSSDIKQYFSMNPNAAEVMVFKGGRQIVVKRNFALNPNFIRDFMMRYNKRKSR